MSWKDDLKKDKKEMEEKPQWRTLKEGKNVFIVDLSTKEKVTRNVSVNGEEQSRTYIMFDLINDDVAKLSLTTYQYATLLKDIDVDKASKIVELIADVKVANNKKIFTFNIINKGD